MRKANRILDIIIWIHAWLIADLVLLWLTDCNQTKYPMLLAMFIGVISYLFADWVQESVQWMSGRLGDWLVRRYVRKMDDLTDEEKTELLNMYYEDKDRQDNDLE